MLKPYNSKTHSLCNKQYFWEDHLPLKEKKVRWNTTGSCKEHHQSIRFPVYNDTIINIKQILNINGKGKIYIIKYVYEEISKNILRKSLLNNYD